MRRRSRRLVLSRSLALALALSVAALAPAHAADRVESSAGPLLVERIAGPFEHPWAVAFLPDGRALVTERAGRLSLIADGAATEVAGAPQVFAEGQGGLLDIALAPDFAASGRLYLTFAERQAGGRAATALAAARLVEGAAPRLDDLRVLWRQEPALRGGRHFGARIVIAPDGALFVTTGDRGEPDLAQALDKTQGKVIRLAADGSIPPDNPFAGGEGGARPEIWSLGHRNLQGADFDAEAGRLVTVEHGARGGDEINRPEAGRNYGWPVVSYGRNYSGTRIGVGSAAPGFEQPDHYWDPSIAPSGLAVYDGALFPDWRGDLFVGALAGRLLARLDREGARIVGEERLFEGRYGRIRDVEVGPEGALWFVTDEGDGGLYRVTPAR